MNEVSHFDRLPQAASAQPEPHRLLYVFASFGVPADATAYPGRSPSPQGSLATIDGPLALDPSGAPLSFA